MSWEMRERRDDNISKGKVYILSLKFPSNGKDCLLGLATYPL